MEISSLQPFPLDKELTIDSPSYSSVFVRKRRLLVDLAWLAAIGFVLFQFHRLRQGIDQPWLDRDLHSVYRRLAAGYELDKLQRGCGLIRSDVSPPEIDQIVDVLNANKDHVSYWCSPFSEYFAEIGKRIVYKSIRWFRLSHKTDRNQWLALGVWYFPDGYSGNRIVCRVPIGF